MAFERKTVNGAVFYTSTALEGSVHAFSTRVGGVSRPPCDSMNLGSAAYDDRDDIMQNYGIFAAAVGFDAESLVFSKQVHGDTVIAAGAEHRGNGFSYPSVWECDALVTRDTGITLTVFTADCVPILLYDPAVRAAGAVHAGWRGTASAIAAKAVRLMREQFGCEDIRAAIGPSIGVCCFETRDDVESAMGGASGRLKDYISQSGDRFHIDLKGINAFILREAGVETIDVSPLCTLCRQDEFFSHRRSGLARGSQAAVISPGGAS